MPHTDQLLYGPEVWPQLTRAATRARRRLVVTAYVGKHAAALLPLAAGDVAVVDGSVEALKAGQTSPDAIGTWLSKGAHVYSHEGLHAKAYLLGDCAFVGSANASRHSQERLLEAMLHTDRPDVREQLRAMVVELAQQAAEPLDRQWVREAKKLYRPSRPPTGRSRPGREQVLPVGKYRLRYDSWTSETVPAVDPQAAVTLAQLSGPGVEIYPWLLKQHDLHPGDVVVLMEYDNTDAAVALWPPMRVLRLSSVRRGTQTLYLRHSKLLQPLPASHQGVQEALRRLRDSAWVDGVKRQRLLNLWGLQND